MKKLFLISGALVFLIRCGENNVAGVTDTADTSFNIEGKKAVVYTTDSVSYRLTTTDTLSFADFDQPLETQPSVFVDPSHQFNKI